LRQEVQVGSRDVVVVLWVEMWGFRALESGMMGTQQKRGG